MLRNCICNEHTVERKQMNSRFCNEQYKQRALKSAKFIQTSWDVSFTTSNEWMETNE